MKHSITISSESPLYKALEYMLRFYQKNVNTDESIDALELLPLLEKVGLRFSNRDYNGKKREYFGPFMRELAFELLIQWQIENRKFYNVDVSVNYSTYHKLVSKLPEDMKISGIVPLEDFLKLSSRTDIVKKRLYMIPLSGLNRVDEIKEFIERIGYVLSGVPELISYVHFIEKGDHEVRFDYPNGVHSRRPNSMAIVELRDSILRGQFAKAVVCIERDGYKACIKTRGIGGGFKNHYVICEKA